MTTALVMVGILVCLCLSAFCSASEMAYSSCNTVLAPRRAGREDHRAL